MKIHIIGAGSLGLLYGGRLAASGADIAFWCRSKEQANLLRERGISIEEPEGSLYIPPDAFRAECVQDYHQAGGPHGGDYTFLMVKQSAVASIATELLSPYADDAHKLLCFQNGTGHMELLREHLPGWTLYAAVTTEGAKRSGAAGVVHAGRGTTWIGQAADVTKDGTGAEGQGSENALIEQLNRAGFDSFLSKELDVMIFRKLLMNAVINPLTALWRIPNGELLAAENRVALMRELYEEGAAVYDACGIKREDDLWEQIVRVCQATSANTSSMLKDVLEGRPTEAASINGSIVRMGENAGIDAPLHRLVWKLIEGIRS